MKNTDKITLTVGQLKRLIKESNEYSDFEIKDGVLVKYHGKDKDVVIPDGVETIGEYAVSGRIGLTSVVIPDSVTKIERFAFNSCPSLINVSIPEGATVEYGAFGNCPNLKTTNIQRRKRSLTSNSDFNYMVVCGNAEDDSRGFEPVAKFNYLEDANDLEKQLNKAIAYSKHKGYHADFWVTDNSGEPIYK